MTEATQKPRLVRNPSATLARFFATVSLVPLVAIITGPLAVCFGIMGLRANRKHPTLHGHRSSWIGIGVGALLFAIWTSFTVRVWVVSWRQYQQAHAQAEHGDH